MPFGLCNAPGTFQRCMMSIFLDLLEECIEIFMDDFTVYGDFFETCLHHLDVVLERCRSKSLVLNYEKCHFMVTEGIVLGHIVSERGIQVDQAKVEVIAKLSHPTNQKEIRDFLGHAGFYRRFITDFAKIAQPLTRLLQNEVEFDFNDACKEAFQLLKERLITALIIRSPDWNYAFEVMCDASDLAVGAVLGQQIDGKSYVIFHVLKALNQVQQILTISTGVAKFDWEVKDKKWTENKVADHLSRITQAESSRGAMKRNMEPWFADLANYLVTGELSISPEVTRAQGMKIKSESKYYFWDGPYLWKMGTGQVIRRCIPEWEQKDGMDFMGPFPSSYGNLYILVAVDYVSNWIEAKATSTCDAKKVAKFLKSNIFSHFGVPRAIISDQRTHFCNRTIEALMKKYGVHHRLSNPYHCCGF
ncbi:hypothetical protein AAHA92_00369 [Salvia divinorum]|uniref:Integrase catalytic domain-containing protein n=1 Tax=Salvia divinorum TaxID=28513 RepID=A0ABD1IJC6_SALDI